MNSIVVIMYHFLFSFVEMVQQHFRGRQNTTTKKYGGWKIIYTCSSGSIQNIDRASSDSQRQQYRRHAISYCSCSYSGMPFILRLCKSTWFLCYASRCWNLLICYFQSSILGLCRSCLIFKQLRDRDLRSQLLMLVWNHYVHWQLSAFRTQ